MKRIATLLLTLAASACIAQNITVPFTGASGSVTIPAPTPGPAGATGPQGPSGPAGTAGSAGAPGVSPSAASVETALAADSAFVKAVAAAVGGTTPPACTSAPPPVVTTQTCPAGTTGSWQQTTTYSVGAAPACAVTSTTLPASPPAGACTAVTPPTSVTLSVVGGKIVDTKGVEFRFRGLDSAHYDGIAPAATAQKMGANSVRMFLASISGSVPAATYASVLAKFVAVGIVPIATVSEFPNGTGASGDTSATDLAAGISWFVTNRAVFAPLDKHLVINLANEWGPSASAAWATANTAAIVAMRGAGYKNLLMVDAGGWGQNFADLQSYAAQVFASDPLHNTVFSLHIYGSIPTASVPTDLAALAAITRSSGAPFVVGEFGPGQNIGPSPTMTTPDAIVAAAEANGIGWIGWAMDDNDSANSGCSSTATSQNWFCMLRTNGTYNSAADLTLWGADFVGLLSKYHATGATDFP